MAKYLITGGCGFIGSQLTKQLLDQAHEVIVVDDLSNGQIIHSQATLVEANVADFDSIHALFGDLDGCFHLAAIPSINMEISDWFRFHATNLEGSLNIFKSAIKAGNIPVVYASSCGVYGDSKRFPLSEGQALKPPSSYGCDKLASELNANFLAQSFQLPSMGLRFFNVYGPYQRPDSPYSGVITHFISNLLRNEPMTIFGDGKQTRDFVYVDDVVDNLMKAMTILKSNAHVVNICSGIPVTVNQLAVILAELFDKQCLINYLPARALDAQGSYGNPNKMHRYGFKLDSDLRQGLIKTIEYFVGTYQ